MIYNYISHRYIICGNPGGGKSTLTLKVVNDWATGAKAMSMFDLVFLVRARDLTDVTCIESYILKKYALNFGGK